MPTILGQLIAYALSQLRDMLLCGGIEDDADLQDQPRELFDEACLEVYIYDIYINLRRSNNHGRRGVRRTSPRAPTSVPRARVNLPCRTPTDKDKAKANEARLFRVRSGGA